MPRLDGIGVSRSSRASGLGCGDEESGNSGESRARWIAGAGRWQELCNFRYGQLPRCAVPATGASTVRHSNRGQNVPAAGRQAGLMLRVNTRLTLAGRTKRPTYITMILATQSAG